MHVEVFDRTFERRVTGVVVALLALLLSAASCGDPPIPPVQVTFDLSVTPGEVELERGGEAVVVVASISRFGGFTGAVAIEVRALPSGVSVDVGGAATAASRELAFSASSAASAGTFEVVVRATDAGSDFVAEETITVVVTDPEPVPTLELTVDPVSVTLERGSMVEVVVGVVTDDASGAPLSLAVLGLPSGVTFEVEAGGSEAERVLRLSAGADAALGTVSLTVRGSIAATEAEVPLNLTVEAAPPTLSIASPGYGSSRQVRQGAGDIEILLEGTGLAGAANPRILELLPGGDAVFGTILEASATSVRIAFSGANGIPHGARQGQRTLVLATTAGPVTIGEAIEITPIVFAADGSPSGVATFDRPAFPYEPVVPIAIAAGDEVVLLEGTYELGDFEVPDGVRMRGRGTVILQPFDADVPGFGLIPLGSAEILNLTLRGFDTALSVAGSGTVLLEDISVEFSQGVGLAVSGFAGPTTVRAVNSRFVSSERDGIRVNDARFEMIGGESSLNGDTGLYVLGDAPVVTLDGVRIAGNGQNASGPARTAIGVISNALDGIELSFEAPGSGSVTVRDTVIEDNARHGVLIREGTNIDFGTASSLGNNDIRGNDGWQVRDERPARVEADGPIAQFVGSRLSGRSDLGAAGVPKVGPASFTQAGVDYWSILNSGNRILLPPP